MLLKVVEGVSAGVVAKPSGWAVDRFGRPVAAELWRLVPQALGAAVARAMDAHEASQMTTNHAFGNSRWPLQYEELVNHLQSVRGAEPIRPPRAFYQLVIVGGHVLLPWCYSRVMGVRIRDVRPGRALGRLARELLARFGPPPRWTQERLPFDDDAEDERDVAEISSVLERFDPPPKVLIVGYACSSRQGLLNVCWGEAAIADDNDLHWYHDEELPLPPPRVPHPRLGDADNG